MDLRKLGEAEASQSFHQPGTGSNRRFPGPGNDRAAASWMEFRLNEADRSVACQNGATDEGITPPTDPYAAGAALHSHFKVPIVRCARAFVICRRGCTAQDDLYRSYCWMVRSPLEG